MDSRDLARFTMEGLDEKCLIENGVIPLTMKWMESDLQAKKRKAADGANTSENRMLFFAKVVRTATEEEVSRLFAEFGRVHDVNLFRAFRGAPITKGCGLVTMGSHAAAAAAITGLDNKYTWPGMEAPMVVKWMDVALQRRRREEHLAAMRNGLVPSMGLSTDVWKTAALSKVGPSTPLMPPMVQASKVEISETPPAGCAADAVKLFIGNVPKTFGEDQLRPLFEPLGQVVELVVVRNKVTNESKGSAFVWYQTRQQAEQAVLHFSCNNVLLDPTIQDKPLVVRRANHRFRTTGHSFWALNEAEVQYDGDLSMDTGIPVHIEPAHFAQAKVSLYPASQVLSRKVATPLSHQNLVPAMPHSSLPTVHSTGNLSYDQYVTLNGMGPVPLADSGSSMFSSQGMPGMLPMSSSDPLQNVSHCSRADLYDLSADLLGPNALDTLGAAPLAGGGPAGVNLSVPGPSSDYSFTMPLMPEQLSVVWNHLYSVQTISGAQVKVASGPQKTFTLLFTGSPGQTAGAQALISAVLSQSGVGELV